ncbi:MAG: phosphodiester glycosidase family protein [Clostridiales bacterium]|nr:phosphodiester glycosidase family protein [Clostridiales bacterium]
MVSASVNYTLNRNLVFQSDRSAVRSAGQYFLLAVVVLTGNTWTLHLLTGGLGMNRYAAKLCTELLFFLLSWSVLYSVLLTAFTVYLALDTFVITRVYAVAAEAESSAQSAQTEEETEEIEDEAQEETETIITETSYSDENITITLTEYREYETAIYVADIVLSSAEYSQTALAENAYGRNVTAKTSEIAESVGAILAINGDYYGAQESGYVIRNGALYRSTASSGQEDLVIYANGSFGIISEDEVTAEPLLEAGAVQVLSFGPALVTEGTVSVTQDEEVGKAKASNPRTAIGIIDSPHYVFVVSDGRTEESAGLTLSELAAFLSELGGSTAYNLDGGGSSTLYFNGQVINQPTTSGRHIKERSVSDIVYIGY